MNYKPLPDDDLVRLSSGDVEAFGELYVRHFDELKGLIQSKFRLPQHDAEDIAQKSFIKAQKNIANFQFKASFKTWVFSIAKNAAIDLIRSKEHNCISLQSIKVYDTDEEVEFKDESISPPDEVLAIQDSALDFAAKIALAKDSLSETQKKIFELVFIERKDYREVAEIMDCPIGTVMSRVYFTRQKLEKMKERISTQS